MHLYGAAIKESGAVPVRIPVNSQPKNRYRRFDSGQKSNYEHRNSQSAPQQLKSDQKPEPQFHSQQSNPWQLDTQSKSQLPTKQYIGLQQPSLQTQPPYALQQEQQSKLPPQQTWSMQQPHPQARDVNNNNISTPHPLSPPFGNNNCFPGTFQPHWTVPQSYTPQDQQQVWSMSQLPWASQHQPWPTIQQPWRPI